MVRLYDIGNYLFQQAAAAATITITPLAGRAIAINRLRIINPSASDNWTISVGNRELMRLPVNTTGNQQFAGRTSDNYPGNKDFFTWYRETFGRPLTFDIPEGMSLIIASVGGATANILVEGFEETVNSPNTSDINHYQGNHFIMPVFGYINAAVTAAGEINLDTMIKPAWVPAVLLNTSLPVGWAMQVLGMWIESGGVNTFSGAADHRSVTDYVFASRNGQRLFTRNNKGIPAIGKPAAAGSANAVFGVYGSTFPPFQFMTDDYDGAFDPPFKFSGGDLLQFGYGITGDVTGGADYSKFLIGVLLDINYSGAYSLAGV